MKKRLFCKINFKRYSGFTLTEVLLAVMIVGIIGVALASLTRAAARESGVGRSKIMLSNNLNSFYRQVRKDLAVATVIDLVEGPLDGAAFDGKYVPLIQFITNGTMDGESIVSGITPKKVVYCFLRGEDQENIIPQDATRGGKIFRLEVAGSQNYPVCSDANYNNQYVVLNNVKYIPDTYYENHYPVPLFDQVAYDGLIRINVITELNTRPVVNEVREEVISLPLGN